MESCLGRINIYRSISRSDGYQTVYYEKDKVKASLKISKYKKSRQNDGENGEITKGDYAKIGKFF